MLHFIMGTALLACLIAFAFGPNVARFFVGALLSVASLAILLAVTVGVIGLNAAPKAQTVHYESEKQHRADLLAKYCAQVPEPPSCQQDRFNAMALR